MLISVCNFLHLTNLCAAFYEVKHKCKIIDFKLILQVFIKKFYKKLLHKKGLAVFYVVGWRNFAHRGDTYCIL